MNENGGGVQLRADPDSREQTMKPSRAAGREIDPTYDKPFFA